MSVFFKVGRAHARHVIDATFPTYRGRTIVVEVTESVTLSDLNWGDGTKSVYKGIRVADGQVAPVVVPAPWLHGLEGTKVQIPAGCVVVEHAVFCGKDMGIRIYVNPADAPKWLTA